MGLVAFLFLNIFFNSKSYGGSLACLTTFQKFTLITNFQNEKNANEFLNQLEALAKNRLSADPLWVKDLLLSQRSKEILEKRLNKFLNKKEVTSRSVRGLVADLYRLRMIEVVSQLSYHPKKWIEFISNLPERVLISRFEKAMLTKGAIEAFDEAGLLSDGSVRSRFYNYLYKNRAYTGITLAAIYNIPSLVFSGISGVVKGAFLPKIDFVSDEKLLREYEDKVNSQNYNLITESMKSLYEKVVQKEIIYNLVRRVTNTAALVALASTVLSGGLDYYHKTTTQKIQNDYAVVQLVDSLKVMNEQTEFRSADIEAQKLLDEFVESQKEKGIVVSENEKKAMFDVMKKSFQ